jgi:hypothetical protein
MWIQLAQDKLYECNFVKKIMKDNGEKYHQQCDYDIFKKDAAPIQNLLLYE